MTDDDPSPEGDSRPRSSGRPSGFALDDWADLHVQINASAWRRALDDADAVVRRAVEAALTVAPMDRTVRSRGAELAVLLIDDPAQRVLNRDHRGKDAATNVLSFPAGYAPPAGPKPLGDITIAYGVSAREAVEQGKTLADHLSHLVVHGVLHLLGHHHDAPDEAEVMESLERCILARLGVADPYADDDVAA
ncbi:MAG: rRNA maturation RNase YbeY [Alphaproteobacteria bacterium]|nr:rRNA maturation RNase YbeY [Alphaproteobacteria bacterium]